MDKVTDYTGLSPAFKRTDGLRLCRLPTNSRSGLWNLRGNDSWHFERYVRWVGRPEARNWTCSRWGAIKGCLSVVALLVFPSFVRPGYWHALRLRDGLHLSAPEKYRRVLIMKLCLDPLGVFWFVKVYLTFQVPSTCPVIHARFAQFPQLG